MVKTVYDPNWAVKWGQNHYKVVFKSYNSMWIGFCFLNFPSDDQIWVKIKTNKKNDKNVVLALAKSWEISTTSIHWDE